MKHFLLLALGSLAILGLIACGKSSSENTVQAPACGVQGMVFFNGSCIPQTSIIGLNAYGQCPAGYSQNGAYCYPTNTAMIAGAIPGVGFYSDNYCGKSGLRIQGAMFKTFLKEAMGVCDRAAHVGGIYSCEAYVNGLFDVVILAPSPLSSTLQATFRAQAPNNFAGGLGQWGYTVPSWSEILWGVPSTSTYIGAYLPKLDVNMTVSVTNANQGFEARGKGNQFSTAGANVIQIKVPNGKLDNPFGLENFQLLYRGEIIAQGRMNRCVTADCGLSYAIGTCF